MMNVGGGGSKHAIKDISQFKGRFGLIHYSSTEFQESVLEAGVNRNAPD